MNRTFIFSAPNDGAAHSATAASARRRDMMAPEERGTEGRGQRAEDREQRTRLFCPLISVLCPLVCYFTSTTHTLRYTTGSPWSWNWNGPGVGSSFCPPGHSFGNSTLS